MTDEFNDIFDPLKREALSSEEREQIRRELRYFMAEHPVRSPRPAFSLGFFTSYSFRRVASGAVAFSLVLSVGVGTSYAAEGALPGDVLYPVKVTVNETVAGALAISPTAKARWNVERATRRLEEAETLAASGRLTAAATEQVNEHLAATSKDFDAVVASLAEREGAEAVADVQSDYEATLSAHTRVLAALQQVLPDSQEKLEPIIATVAARRGVARESRERADHLAVAAKQQNKTSLRASVQDTKEAALDEVAEVRAFAAQVSENDSATSANATLGAALSQEVVQAGDKKMNDGDLGKALSAYQTAIRVAQEAKIQAKINARLKEQLDVAPQSIEDAVSGVLDAFEHALQTSSGDGKQREDGDDGR